MHFQKNCLDTIGDRLALSCSFIALELFQSFPFASVVVCLSPIVLVCLVFLAPSVGRFLVLYTAFISPPIIDNYAHERDEGNY